ncbi:MAG: NAD(P)/FAD-dependent oxidoreductase [Clostridioides sp.]|nr:NAD(P)/FAD-dependent oxidoreductase [Clostridioides sp.]
MAKIIVIGGGASGMMSAITAGKNNNEVILVERNGELGRKLRATGGGRCNFTNYRNIEDFFDKIVNNKKFLFSSLYTFTNTNLIDLFVENGLDYHVEEENDYKVYTGSDRSEDLIETLYKLMVKSKVHIMLGKKVVDLIIEESKVKGVILDSGEKLLCDKVIVSTGGKSFKATGSDGSMYGILSKYGHTIVDQKPALVPLTIDETWIKQMQGISMKDVAISWKIKKKKFEKRGDMLFTHFGISGPAVLITSSYINKLLLDGNVELSLDYLPDVDRDVISSVIRENPNKNIQNNLKEILPQNFVRGILEKLNLAEAKANELKKAQEIQIVDEIKNMKLTCNGTTGLNSGMVTSGGVSTKEIDSSTMMSKKIDGLYLTGEVIDVDAETGGYNLQIAFSTGFLAGSNV